MKASAITVGIDKYKEFRSLSYCSNDSIAIDRALERHFREINTISINTKEHSPTGTTLAAVRASLSRMQTFGLTVKDVAIFYFAGHGVATGGKDFLILNDTIRGDISSTALSVDEIMASLLNSGAGTSILILDACRNLPDRGDTDFGKFTSELARRKGVLVFFGCSPGEVCQELAEMEHGIFTQAFLEALEQQRPATALAIDSAVIERVRQISSDSNLGPQSPYTIVAPVQKATIDLLTGLVVPQAYGPSCSCIVIAGPPNSGKTTVGQYLSRTRGFLHLEMSSFAWRRYDIDGDHSLSIQEYMEQVVWNRGDKDIIAKDLLDGLTNPSRIVICGPRTVEEVETLRSQGWDFELIFLHANSTSRFNRFRTALEKHNRWDPSYRDVVLRDYRELSWGLAKIPLMTGALTVMNESALPDLHLNVDRIIDSHFPTQKPAKDRTEKSLAHS